MRYRITFVTGLAAGFVAGAWAGRERYEQLKKLARAAAESSAVQQAKTTISTKATELAKSAGQQAAAKMPKVTEAAKSTIGSGIEKIPHPRGRNNGSHAADGSVGDTVADTDGEPIESSAPESGSPPPFPVNGH
jgi:hypothetical protein